MGAQRTSFLVENLTLVLSFFTSWYLRMRPSLAGDYARQGRVSRVSQKRGIAIPPMGHRLGSPWPTRAPFLKSLKDVSRFDAPSAASRENKGDIGRGLRRLLDAILL